MSAALRSTHLPTPPTHTHQPRGARTVAVALQAEAPRSLFCAHMDPVCRDTGTCFSARTQKPEVFARGLVRANKHRWSAPCPHADAAVDNQMRAKARRNSCAPCWSAAVCMLGVYVASTLASNALWARHGGPLQWRAAACSQQSRGAICGAATSTARAHHAVRRCAVRRMTSACNRGLRIFRSAPGGSPSTDGLLGPCGAASTLALVLAPHG